MKNSKIFKVLFALFLGVSLIFSIDQEVDAGVGDTIAQTFPDPNMAQAVAGQVAGGNVNAIITQSMVNSTTSLYLPDNNISDITGIDTFSNLTWLALWSNQITSLPDSIGNLSNLGYLGLNTNKITVLPDSIVNLTNLYALVLDSNQLTSIPTNIGNMTGLEYLDLTRNRLTSVPDSIGNLVNVTDFRVDSNLLTSLPDSIGNMSSLTYLYAGENQITRIPDTIGNLTNLNQLEFSYNQLTSLPDSILNLSNLYLIGVQNNQITRLPQNIESMTNLEMIYILENSLINLPQVQYNFITSIYGQNYALEDQSYSTTISQRGFVDENYVFNALPAQTQFLNYGMTFSFSLVTPSGQNVAITPVISNGVITIPASFLANTGRYTLVTEGTGGALAPVHYEQSFNIIQNVASDAPTINQITEGDEVVTGTGISGSEIVVTFPDGSTETTTVNSNGRWSVSTPDSLVEGERVTAVQTEQGKAESEAVETIVRAVSGGNIVDEEDEDDSSYDSKAHQEITAIDTPETGDNAAFIALMVIIIGALASGGYFLAKRNKK